MFACSTSPLILIFIITYHHPSPLRNLLLLLCLYLGISLLIVFQLWFCHLSPSPILNPRHPFKYYIVQLMLNPLRHLKGKLNHLRVPATQFMRTVEIVNSIQGNGSSLVNDQSVDVKSIEALASKVEDIQERKYHRFEFQYMVHTTQSVHGLPSTVYDQLSAHERKISLTVQNFTNTLNQRQLLYLNMAIRHKINKEYPDWKRLHLAPQSPFKTQMEVLPSLTTGARLNQLKALEKKGVMAKVIKAKQ